MTTTIDGFAFDRRDGEILVPQRTTKVFASPTTPHVGMQVIPAAGPPFQLTLTRYTNTTDVDLLSRQLIDNVGSTVQVVADGVFYIFTPYRLRFLVVDVQIIEKRALAHVITQRSGIDVDYAPAGKVVSRWTMQAVPDV